MVRGQIADYFQYLLQFTLYFYRLLSNSGMMAEVKGLSSKFDVDYIQT